MTSDCYNCTAAASRPIWGGYSFACARCCARILWSARADQLLWDANMEAIRRFNGKPERSAIAAAYKELQAVSGNLSQLPASPPSPPSPSPPPAPAPAATPEPSASTNELQGSLL